MKNGRYNLWEGCIRLCFYSAHYCNEGGWFRRNILALLWALGFVASVIPYVLWMERFRNKKDFAYLELF